MASETRVRHTKRRESKERDDHATKKQAKQGQTADAIKSALQRHIFDPSIVSSLETQMKSLDNTETVPWRLRIESESSKGESPYPPYTYLQLRLRQHQQWATQRLEEGVRLAREGKSAQAEECYKEGLSLVPKHASLLVAWGALCATLGKTQEAIDKLKAALDVDPDCPNAREYLEEIQNPKPKVITQKQPGSVNRSETAMQDVMMERYFLSGTLPPQDLTRPDQAMDYPTWMMDEGNLVLIKDNENGNQDNGSLAEESSRRRRDRKRHRKSDSKRKRKRKRERSPSLSESDESSRRRRHKRKKKKHSHRRHKHRHRRKDGKKNGHGSDSDPSRGREEHRR